MIGVIANQEEHELVCEFFELFKTPWEFYRPDEQYEVVLVTQGDERRTEINGSLVVVYSSQNSAFVEQLQIEVTSSRIGGMLSYRESHFPIYGKIVTLKGTGIGLVTDQDTNQPVGLLSKSGSKAHARIGYDLFRELHILLTAGQPFKNAAVPTLEMHIAILRDLIVGCGIPLVEIPATPKGYTFIACLTHDIDHPSIRRHKWDHTTLGFLYRAVIGSVFGVLKGRRSIRDLITNWMAAIKLPFIHLRLARDFWYEFDRYLEIEKDLDSTFFVLPFQGRPGKSTSGPAPEIRASSYGAADISERLQGLVSAGREIGLHGIDAWIDPANGQEEKAQVTNITASKNIGVRMHWLYFNENSPAALESAGFTYDSTVGYNETIGYRAGTTQVYKLPPAHDLLELPLHVMDTALFYPGYLNLSFYEARKRVRDFMDNAIRFGGAVTFNWHDRSIAPERLWGEFYKDLLGQLQQQGAWCTSAGSAVSWFQNRRSVVFVRAEQGLQITQMGTATHSIPGLRVRLYNSRGYEQNTPDPYIELAFARSMTLNVGLVSLIAEN